ncbi:MAG: ABC transporter ATP-binding protein [Eubacteriales bacterium]|jgi:ABC-2 type transport system ATP-binding protein|nr:ABC transporter ATP-binding protein [Eubacteriales bacterium]
MNAIELNSVTKRYDGFQLDKVSFTLPRGAILGLVGENGAGKSTTIKLIMNAIRRDGGAIRVLGEDNTSEAFRAVKEDIGIVLDEAYFPEVLNAVQVGAVMKQTYRRWDNNVYQNHLKLLDIPQKKVFREFSRGMKMKLALAVALSHQPKLLILDEATSGLDPMVRDEILTLFNNFTRNEEHSILLSSHIVSDLEKVCDYIAFLHEGKLVLCEEKDRLLEEYAIVKTSQSVLDQLSADTIISTKSGPYGVEALVKRERAPHGMQTEFTTLETIILFLAKGGDRA